MAENPDEGESLDGEFNKAIESYTKLTGISSKEIKNGACLTVDSMKTQKKAIFEKVDPQIKHAAQITLDLFLNLGEFGIGVAAGVWPPAAICFNATKYLVESAKHFKKYNTSQGILEIINRVNYVLDDVRRYVDGFQDGVRMDKTHQGVVMRRLKIFLELCGIATKVRKESTRVLGVVNFLIKTGAKDDRGIEEKLKEMEQMRQREQQILLGDTWRITQMIGSHFNVKGDTKTRDLEKIEQMLHLPNDNHYRSSWIKTHSSLTTEAVENTGTWLLQNEYFKSWADIIGEPEKTVLTLEAPEGGGKSHLCRVVIDEMRRRCAEHPSSASVAYFYFESMNRTGRSEGPASDSLSIRDAMATLIWQISQSDPAFRTFASVQSNLIGGFPSTIALWDILMKFPQSKSTGSRKTFFLILDGVNLATSVGHYDLKQTLSHIIKGADELQSERFQVRILFSTVREFFENLSPPAKAKLRRLNVPQRNQEDMERFVSIKMGRMREAWGNKENSELLYSLKRKILRDSNGSYHEAISVLDEIEQTGGSQDQLDNIWNRKPRDRRQLLLWRVHMLDDSLSSDEIDQLNKILVCVHFMQSKPRLEQLRWFLKLSTGGDLPERLKEKIHTRYGQLLSVLEDTTVTVKSTEPEPPYIKRTPTDKQISHQRLSSRDMRATVNRLRLSEIDAPIPPILSAPAFRRFETVPVNEGLRSEREVPRAAIGIYEVNSHLGIIACLLKAVCDPSRNGCLNEYAGKSLLFHLKKVSTDDLSETSEEIRTFIGLRLLSFFCDEATVQVWLTESTSCMIIKGWSDWYESLSEVFRWLNDPIVNRAAFESSSTWEHLRHQNRAQIGLAPAPKQQHRITSAISVGGALRSILGSFQTLIGYHEDNREDLVFTPLKSLASLWLMHGSWDASHAFRSFLLFSSKFLLKNQDPNDTNDEFLRETMEKGFSEKRVPQFDIERAERFAIQVLGDKLLDTGAKNLRIAETYVSERYPETAITVLPKESMDWKICWCYAQAYKSLNQESKALFFLEKVIPELEKRDFWLEHESAWTDMVDTLCLLYKELHAHEEAFKFFRRLQKSFPQDAGIMEKVLKWIEDNCGSPGLAKYLNLGQITPVELFVRYATEPGFHHSVYVALEKDFSCLNRVYSDSIEADSSDLVADTSLRYYHGLALFYQYRLGQAEKVWNESIKETDHILVKTQEHKDELLSARTRSAERLASHYIQLIRKLGCRNERTYDCLSKIMELKSWNDRAFAESSHSLSLLLGRAWLVIDRTTSISRWCVRGHIQKAMELLSDETISNDWEGYWLLCQAFIPLQDDSNALAAWSLIADDYFYMDKICDGKCGCTWTGWARTEMYVCRDCADVKFDECCWIKLKSGKLEELVCGKDHDFISLPRWQLDAAKKRLEDQTVQIGDSKKKIEDWKHDIKKKYGLEPEEQSEWHQFFTKRFRGRKL